MVDHRIEVKDGGALTEEENAMSMCWKCHGIKTAQNKVKNMNKNHQLPTADNRSGSTKDTY
jgi:5-methylcytosine-specific restriction endonuclease McrA